MAKDNPSCPLEDCFADRAAGNCKHPSDPVCVRTKPACSVGVVGCNRSDFHIHTDGLAGKIEALASEVKEHVDHPSHYGGDSNPYETIKVIVAWGLGFSLGNAIKYISRAGKKDPQKLVEDLEKAKWYLDEAIARAKTGVDRNKL